MAPPDSLNSIASLLQNQGKLLFIVSHPDDMEGFFGGTIVQLLQYQLIQPQHIFLLQATQGGRGGRHEHEDQQTLENTRLQEQYAVLDKLGVPHENYTNLQFEDGSLQYHESDLLERVVYHLRRVQPALVATHNGAERIFSKSDGSFVIIHGDHHTLGQVVLNAMYPFSRDKLFFPEHAKEFDFQHYELRDLLTAEVGTPNVVIPTESVLQEKAELMALHASQFESQERALRSIKKLDFEVLSNTHQEKFRLIHINH